MRAEARPLLEFMENTKKLRIPIYQRTYSWRREDCTKFWSDIILAGRDERLTEHFLGAIVFVTDAQSSVPEVMVIDGQQRLTTMTLLLAALEDAIGDNEVEGFSAELLRDYYLNEKLKGDNFYKLHLTKADRDTLKSIVSSQAKNSKNYTARPDKVALRVDENHKLFKDLLNGGPEIIQYLCRGLRKLMIVEIGLDRHRSNPQLIFESMNSTGLDLTQADLIRNYILMGQSPDQQEQLYNNHWYPMEMAFGPVAYERHFDSFIRHFLTLRTGEIPKQTEVYQAFKVYARRLLSGGYTVQKLVADLHVHALLYCLLIFPKTAETDLPISKATRAALVDLHELNVEVVNPFMLRVLEDFRKANLKPGNDEPPEAPAQLDDAGLREIIQATETYVFRRMIFGLPTNSHSRTFAALSQISTDVGYMEAVRASFHALASYKRLPGDEEFKEALKIKDLYNIPRRTYWMRRLENHDRKELVDVHALQIEHIMPQHLSDAWCKSLGDEHTAIHKRYLHTLGNLTLTGANAALGNRSFPEKLNHKHGFKSSPLNLNKGLAELGAWGCSEIEKRANDLADLAAKVWERPPEPVNPIASPTLDASGLDGADWVIEDHAYLVDTSAIPRKLFDALASALTGLDPNVTMHVQKQYIAFRADQNFTCVIPQKNRLRIRLSLRKENLDDPRGEVEDTSMKGGWGTGVSDVILKKEEELPYIVELCEQAFLAQMGEELESQ